MSAQTTYESYKHTWSPARMRGMAAGPDLASAIRFARWLYNFGDVPSDYVALRDAEPNTHLYAETVYDPAARTNRGATALVIKSTTTKVTAAYRYATGDCIGGTDRVAMLTLLRPGVFLHAAPFIRPGENNFDDERVDPGVLPDSPIVSVFLTPPPPGGKYEEGNRPRAR